MVSFRMGCISELRCNILTLLGGRGSPSESFCPSEEGCNAQLFQVLSTVSVGCSPVQISLCSQGRQQLMRMDQSLLFQSAPLALLFWHHSIALDHA